VVEVEDEVVVEGVVEEEEEEEEVEEEEVESIPQSQNLRICRVDSLGVS